MAPFLVSRPVQRPTPFAERVTGTGTHHQDFAILSDAFPAFLTHVHAWHLTVRDGASGRCEYDTHLQLGHQTAFGKMRPEGRVVAGGLLNRVIREGRDELVRDETGFGDELAVEFQGRRLAREQACLID